jgi:hypothetical protein
LIFFVCDAGAGVFGSALAFGGGGFLLRKLFGFLGFAVAFAICLRGAGGLVVLALPLASAFCLRASSVAPVRGGTYFSLPPQRKVGKRKRLTPPVLVSA